MQNSCRGDGAKDGQSLVESCIIICLIAFIFAGLFQLSQLFAAREILYHAASCGTRAKTVGLNWWMVEKAIRVAAIPNAGLMTTPVFTDQDLTLEGMVVTLRPGALWQRVLDIVPSSLQYNIEAARIPDYLASGNQIRGDYILNYVDWRTITGNHNNQPVGSGAAPAFVDIQVAQAYPLRIPAHRAFYGADSVQLEGQSEIENYYPLYLNDMGW